MIYFSLINPYFLFTLLYSCTNSVRVDGKLVDNIEITTSIASHVYKKQLVDTLFSGSYFYPFSAYNNQIVFVEKNNTIYLYDQVTKKKEKVFCDTPTKYEVHFVTSYKNILIIGTGTPEQIDTTFFVNRNDCKVSSKIAGIQPKRYLANGSLVAVDTKSHDFDFFFVVIDPITSTTIHKFQKNTKVIFSDNMFVAINKDESKIYFYDLDFKQVNIQDFFYKEDDEIVYVAPKFYLTINGDIIYKTDFNGSVQDKWNLKRSFYRKVYVDENTITVYAWLNTKETGKSKYYFIKEEISF